MGLCLSIAFTAWVHGSNPAFFICFFSFIGYTFSFATIGYTYFASKFLPSHSPVLVVAGFPVCVLVDAEVT
jgi:hypothetical protein